MFASEPLEDQAEARRPPLFAVEHETIDATTAWDLRPVLLAALEEHNHLLYLDLRRVCFIDSTGLGMLLGILKEARRRDGGVHLVNAGREVRRVLQVTGLGPLFGLGAHLDDGGMPDGLRGG